LHNAGKLATLVYVMMYENTLKHRRFSLVAIAIVFFLPFFPLPSRAAEGDLIWAVRAGGPGNEDNQGAAPFDDGTTVITGYFNDTATFGAGEANETVLSSAGEADIFVAKYDSDGTLIWAIRTGGIATDIAKGITPLSDGTSVVTGYFYGTATFGAGEANETTFTSAGEEDIFVAKYNAAGTLAWAKRAGGTLLDRAKGIASYSDGSTVITGAFSGSATFGAGEANETVLASPGDWDGFIARYNADGTLAWAKRAGGSSRATGKGITSFSGGTAVMVGRFSGSATFGPGEANETTLTSAGDLDICVAKYNADGTLAWAKRAGGTIKDDNQGAASFDDGSSVVIGYFGETATFGAGEANETTLTSAGSGENYDVCVAKYNSDGTLAWAKRAGGTDRNLGKRVTSRSDGTSIVTGRMVGTATFGPGEANETTLTSAGDYEAFIAKYNADGALAWAKRAGGTLADRGKDVAASSGWASMATGYFSGTATFGAGEANETTLTSAGGWDIYLAKYVCGDICVKVNFQPAVSVVPEGYQKDDGTGYGPKLSFPLPYGWR